MPSSIKVNTVDASPLNVRVKETLLGIIKGETDGIFHEIRRNLLQWSIWVILIKHVDAVNTCNAGEHQECIIFCKDKKI